jgi:ABC-type Fe3+-hydroxamate transport system substrate-binding protein
VADVVRIVSLVPSITETLAAWNREPVACTRFCERPDLLHVGGTKDPNIARIIELAPDLVVVDAEENRREDYDEMIRRGLTVHALRVRSVNDVNAALAELGARVGVTWSRIAMPDPRPARIRAFIPIWRRPWMALGAPTYGTSLLNLLGITNAFESKGAYPGVTLEEAARARPDVVLAPSEPYPFTTRQLDELETVAPTLFVDGKDLFWWGVRTPSAIERLGHVMESL